jgi:starch synthase
MPKSSFIQPVAQRIMQLSANAAPGVGGQGLNLQHMLAALGPDFALRVFCRGGPDEARDAGTQRVPGSRRAKFIGRWPYLRRLRDWQVYFSDSDFDAFVAAHMVDCEIVQGATGQCALTLAAARRSGKRTVLDVVTTHVDDFYAAQQRACAAFGVRPVFNEKMRQRMLAEYAAADLVRVMSSHARETFIRRGFPEERIVAAAPPVEMGDFDEAKFTEARFRVSFVGLLEPWKGFHYLVQGFRAADLPDSELVLWGGPGSRGVSRYLARQMNEDTRIRLQPVSVRQVGYAEVYGRSNVLVHPSLTDGFGLTVAEAMAGGIPVIVTSATGAAEWVQEGVSGFIVPAGDGGAIAERLRWLHANPARAREMGKAARDAMQQLTMERFRDIFVRRVQAL